jgi:hypothetical protein
MPSVPATVSILAYLPLAVGVAAGGIAIAIGKQRVDWLADRAQQVLFARERPAMIGGPEDGLATCLCPCAEPVIEVAVRLAIASCRPRGRSRWRDAGSSG